jgi:hypothetical protein
MFDAKRAMGRVVGLIDVLRLLFELIFFDNKVDLVMGLNCPSGLRREQQDESLPVFNMIVVGSKQSGKSSLITRLGT